MSWQKLGQIYATDAYAQCPTPLVMNDRVRIYISSREDGKSYIRFVDLSLDDPTKVIGESGCILSPGALGAADQDGQIPSFASQNEVGVFLYYSGWTALLSGAYQNCTMLARDLKNGGAQFERVADGPILDRTEAEPYLAVTPCVMNMGRYCEHMWYVSGLRWEMIDGRPEPIYAIHQAVGSHGCDTYWRRLGIAIEQSHPLECHSRPWVIKHKGKRRMWFSHRSAIDYRDGPNAYRMGYAEFLHGRWKRMDEKAGIDVGSPGEWDDKMIAYPAVFKVKEKTYMLYNGNGFGKYGFGLAVAQ